MTNLLHSAPGKTLSPQARRALGEAKARRDARDEHSREHQTKSKRDRRTQGS